MNAKKFRTILMALIVLFALLLAVFLAGRYGWKLLKFDACEGAAIQTVTVSGEHVEIVGGYPGSFPSGFLGYYAEERDRRLYVGFQFSALFGFWETGDFHITIPTDGEVTQVYLKTGSTETLIWQVEVSPYADILAAYAQALREGWDGAALMEAELNYLAAEFEDPAEDIGFLETDLDGNGTPELLIGILSEADPFYSKMILSLYALDTEGAPTLVFDSTERSRYYYAGDIRFANLGSGAYNSSFETTVKFEDNEMIDMTYTTAPEDYVLPELTPFSQWRNEP